MSELRFDDKVAIVTGAGNGLGRSHARLLASRGAKVVVNDLGTSHTGKGKGSEAADRVVAEITEAGGEAVPNYDSVVDGEKVVQTALDEWGRVDIIVNNAGILRDVSYHKMSQADWDLVYEVHVLGAHRVTHAAWPHMREQRYGRIVNTASAAGIYGNFGQVNYAMAKLGLVGFSNSLAIEGSRRNIHANVIAPIAGSRMTETVLPPDVVEALDPEYVSPLVAWLCHEHCEESGSLFEVGGGYYGKLRWERAEGKMWRLGRDITPEDMKRNWDTIGDFDDAEHPATVMESMAPIMANVSAGESKGGNEFIDVDEALGFEFPEQTSSYDERDLSLYALGVGAAEDPLDDDELQLVYEMHGSGFKPLPTYAVIPALNVVMEMAKEGIQPPGMNYGLDRILHGEQFTEIYHPLPTEANLTHTAHIADIWDKGKNALVITEVDTFDDDGDLLAKNRITTLVRGAGGWGGERGPTEEVNVPPERDPDAVVEQKTDENQALLYRLSGDWNPLHADPSMAQAFGFEKPILHGLCTFGFAARHVIGEFAPDADPRYFKNISARFADSVFPGETLVTEMWKESDTKVVFRTRVKERESDVITRAAIELYEEIPKKKPEPESTDDGAVVNAEPISADVFTGIRAYFEQKESEVNAIGKVFKFELTNPESTWTLDCNEASVAPGETTKPDCTLQLSDADFMAMCAGEADPMKLFSSGALKISGDVMASQKLEFLQEIDPQLVMDAAKARAGGSGDVADTDAGESSNPVEDVFLGIAAYIEGNSAITSIGKTFVFDLKDPDSSWTLDLEEGRVRAGSAKADCTLELSQEDFMAMTSGEADPMKLFSTGKLKISGDVMASQKLEFLQEIDPEEARKAVEEARAAGKTLLGSESPDAGAASDAVNATKVFEALSERLVENTDLASEVNAVLQFNVTSPDSAWVVDMTGEGEVSEGTDDEPATTFTIADSDLVELAGEEPDVEALYMKGTLRVDGDVTNARKLGFMKGLA